VNLTKDAVVEYLPSGTPKTNFTIACNDPYYDTKKKEQVNKAYFFKVIIWGKLGESLLPYLKKGSKVDVSGKLIQYKFEGKTGTVTCVEIHADNIVLISSKNTDSSKPSNDASDEPQAEEINNNVADDDEIPF